MTILAIQSMQPGAALRAAGKDRNRESAIHTLAREIARVTDAGDAAARAVPGLILHRRHVADQPMPCTYGFGIGVVAQGGKQAILAERVYTYQAGDAMLTTVDVPVVANVTRASPDTPFLGLVLAIEPVMVLEQITALRLDQAAPPASGSIAFGALDDALLDTLTRLVKLQHEPQLLPVLAPLVQREIVTRLLDSAFGAVLRQVVAIGSPNHQIVKAVDWLKHHFAQNFNVDALAAIVHMSPSSFRQHFRKATGLSPLQYQKRLRLQEARQLMLSRDIDAGSAGITVGYESASQFSREYARLFGLPPARDIQRTRRAGSGNGSGRG